MARVKSIGLSLALSLPVIQGRLNYYDLTHRYQRMD